MRSSSFDRLQLQNRFRARCRTIPSYLAHCEARMPMKLSTPSQAFLRLAGPAFLQRASQPKSPSSSSAPGRASTLTRLDISPLLETPSGTLRDAARLRLLLSQNHAADSQAAALSSCLRTNIAMRFRRCACPRLLTRISDRHPGVRRREPYSLPGPANAGRDPPMASWPLVCVLKTPMASAPIDNRLSVHLEAAQLAPCQPRASSSGSSSAPDAVSLPDRPDR